ncbi:MAG: 30S ribosomal protein S17 [Gammaproteobacteria bacterium]|nr:30S ribosomal protein S17 [Gammaproteobacteria bacterium]MDH5659733.1 30S ribosomal protein S17 [Gammaproteobacteria bacterium]
MTEETKTKRSVTGKVISNKMDKTITVMVERKVKHPVYGKYIKRSTKLHAHDASNECNEGDLVTVVACRPLSKSKKWMLENIVERATVV